MAKVDRPKDTNEILETIISLLQEFSGSLEVGDVGEQVCHLVEIHHRLRDLGVAVVSPVMMQDKATDSGRARILAYLRNQVGRIVHTDELLIVAAISDYPRRIRELRTNFGWPIISGHTIGDLRKEARALAKPGERVSSKVAPDEYVLLEDRDDADAIRRWKTAGDLRSQAGDLGEKLLMYLQQAAGKRVTAEELRYVANDDPSWPMVIRALQQKGQKIERDFGSSTAVPAAFFIYNEGS